MAVVTTVSNHTAYQLGVGNIDFSNDVFKIILMNTTFAFNKDTHATLADVTADQLATGNGYTQNNYTLAGVTVTEDDTLDGLTVTWDNAVWTASGGSIGPTGAAVIYDDTTTDDTVLMCIDFGIDITVPDTLTLTVESIEFRNLTA